MSRSYVDDRPLRAAPIISGMDSVAAGTAYRRDVNLEHHVLVLTRGGAAAIGPLGAMFPQRTGDIILIDPGCAVNQDNAPDRSWQRIWAIFDIRPHWYDWLDWPQLAPGYRQIHLPSVRRGAPVRSELEAMHHHAAGAHRRRGDLAMNALEAALILCDNFNPRSSRGQGGLDPRVARATDFVCRNLGEHLTLDHIADAAHLSVPHLVKLFRAQLELSPMQFVERQRMQRASQLLQMTAKPVAAIAAEVGYHDPFYFSTRFKRYARTSPRSYRQSVG